MYKGPDRLLSQRINYNRHMVFELHYYDSFIPSSKIRQIPANGEIRG